MSDTRSHRKVLEIAPSSPIVTSSSSLHSGDIMASTVIFGQDNLTDLYNNPADILDRARHPSNSLAKLNSKAPTKWSLLRLSLFLSPSFCIEFARIFAVMLMIINNLINSTLITNTIAATTTTQPSTTTFDTEMASSSNATAATSAISKTTAATLTSTATTLASSAATSAASIISTTTATPTIPITAFLWPLLSGLLSLAMIPYISKRFKNSRISHSRMMIYLLAYHFLLIIATLLIAVPSWMYVYSSSSNRTSSSSPNTLNYDSLDRTDSENHNELLLSTVITNSVIGATHEIMRSDKDHNDVTHIDFTHSLSGIILPNIGFIILASATGSGHFLLLCLADRVTANHVTEELSSATVSGIQVVLSAVGACMASLAGIVVVASNWCPVSNCPSHVITQTAVISTLCLGLLVVGLTLSLTVYYYDVIKDSKLYKWAMENVCQCCSTDEKEPLLWDKNKRRTTRTAQEIYDECAPLLASYEVDYASSSSHHKSLLPEEGAAMYNNRQSNNRNNNFPGSFEPRYGSNSRNNNYSLVTTTNNNTNSNNDNKRTKTRFPSQITSSFHVPEMRKLVKTRRFIGVCLSAFLLSCTSLTAQFYSVAYVSQTKYDYEYHRQTTANVIDTKAASGEIPFDTDAVFGLEIGGLALFLSHLLFIPIFMKREALIAMMKPVWKKWIVLVFFLILFVFTVTTAATKSVATFLLVHCLLSVCRVLEARIHHDVFSKFLQTWPPVVAMPTDPPRVFLESLVPLSLVVSMVTTLILQAALNQSATSSLISMSAFSLLTAVVFGAFKINPF